MKQLLTCIAVLVICSSCSSKLFQKKEKLGCKTDGRNVGAEKILSGDANTIKASKKAKYRGGNKAYNF